MLWDVIDPITAGSLVAFVLIAAWGQRKRK
jgi:hypothetical protein